MFRLSRKLVATSVLAMGVVASTRVASAAAAPAAAASNYDESKILPYTLPDLFTLADGGKVTTSASWEGRRRGELLELFRREMYGFAPPKPESLAFSLKDSDARAMEGKATRKQIAVSFQLGGETFTFHLTLFVPNQRTAPAPVFLLLNHRSVDNTDPTRAKRSEFWPAEDVIARGYAIAAINVSAEVEPDRRNATDGVRAFYRKHSAKPDEFTWGALAAWSWAGSRAIDYFVTDPDINAAQVAFIGHSRSGKSALWAAAQDPRIALACVNGAGEGGPALSRRNYGETIRQITTSFPYWFAPKYATYAGKEHTLPFDQHQLVALVAPRGYHGGDAVKDSWADPRGSWLSLVEASKVWEMFGKAPALKDDMPRPNDLRVSGPLAYHIRDGVHNLTALDWKLYLDHADQLAAAAEGAPATAEVSRAELLDRIHGGWVGMLIGGLEGLPHEFKYNEQPRDTLPEFSFLEQGARSDDDNDFEWPHLFFMDKEGTLKLPYPRIVEIWKANMNTGIWVANKTARELMDQGVVPPESGTAARNPHAWYNLSGQFCVEAYGLIAPGMPQTAADIGLHYARIAVSGEPLQATQFWTSLISLRAFHPGSIEEAMQLALAAVDPQSAMAEVVADACRAFHSHPDDWKAARQELHHKWRLERKWNDNSTPVNGAAVCLALLYGRDDFYRTLQYAMALGYDADCNAATAGTVVGVRLGFKRIAALSQFKMPDRYLHKTRPQLPAECKVSEQAETLLRVAERAIVANGGEGITIAGQPGYRVKFQQPCLIEPLPEKAHGPRNQP